MRIIHVVVLLTLLSLGSGCPQPIESTDTANSPAGDVAVATPELEISMDQSLPGDEGVPEDPEMAGEPPLPETGAETTETGGPVDRPKGFLETLSDRLTGGNTGPQPEGPVAKSNEPAAPVAEPDAPLADAGESPAVDPSGLEDPQAALDAGRMLYDDADPAAAPAFKEPAARVSRQSVAFAGDWLAVVVNQAGRVQETGGDDEWRFSLADDGHGRITQHVNGDIWEQTGGWEFVGTELTLSLGPGGQRSYSVEQPRDDVAILADQTTGAVLFCLRVDEGVKAPMLLKRYDSDFGTVEFKKSGQVYWKGTYGEPAGTLLTHIIGTYLVGTWEQQPGKGFVLLELAEDGFDGWWWYEASTEFDGPWRGSAAK